MLSDLYLFTALFAFLWLIIMFYSLWRETNKPIESESLKVRINKAKKLLLTSIFVLQFVIVVTLLKVHFSDMSEGTCPFWLFFYAIPAAWWFARVEYLRGYQMALDKTGYKDEL